MPDSLVVSEVLDSLIGSLSTAGGYGLHFPTI
jgi:hypothetical protein